MSNETTPVVTAVFGDIHGMHDQFLELVGKLVEEFKDNPEQDLRLVFLGDYIDRGPKSKEVVDKIISLRETFGDEAVITLKGNHEEMLLDAMRGGQDDLGLFMINGGLATMRSYGVSSPKDIPFAHKEFYRTCRNHYEDKLRYYVHAGVAPNLPLREQSKYDGHQGMSRQWIRDPFLQYKKRFEKYIVHGHTPSLEAQVLDNRCNLDSGGVFSGSLTCGLFNETDEKPYKLLTVNCESRSMHV
jgi:serine/threonine protein phosphatase 1